MRTEKETVSRNSEVPCGIWLYSTVDTWSGTDVDKCPKL